MPEFHQGTLVVTVPPHFPTMHTRETVMHLAAFGCNEAQIAVILKCTVDDVQRHYQAELEHGLARVNAQVMSAVLHAALYADSAADRKLWLVNRAGWRSGDGPRMLQPQGGDGANEGEMQVLERRTIISEVLTRVTKEKRHAEKVIDGRVVATQAPGANGAKKPNGNGSNGSGHK